MSNESKKTNQRLFCEVVLPHSNRLFTYELSVANRDDLLGHRVVVPFRGRLVVGVLWRIISEVSADYAVKEVVAIPDRIPIWGEKQRSFLAWLSRYYQSSFNAVARMALAGVNTLFNIAIRLREGVVPKAYEGDCGRLLGALSMRRGLSWKEAAKVVAERDLLGFLHKLLKEGTILLVPPLVPMGWGLWLRPKEGYSLKAAQAMCSTRKQRAVLAGYTLLAKENGVWLSDLKKYGSTAVIDRLVSRGLFVKSLKSYPLPVWEHPPTKRVDEGAVLDHEVYQQKINNVWKDKPVTLLFGKGVAQHRDWGMRFFLSSLQEEGLQGLYLVPKFNAEVGAMLDKFGEQVAWYDGGLTGQQKYRVWLGVAMGHIRWVMGTKAALLLPFRRLGKVFVSEEHSRKYALEGVVPYFHGRNAAVMLAGYHGAKTLLIGHVPSLESYYNVRSRKYGHVYWPGKILRPDALRVVVHQGKKAGGVLWGEAVHQKMVALLSEKCPVVVIAQRKGYAAYHFCGACNWLSQCRFCGVSLTFYQDRGLICGYCGDKMAPLSKCPACGSAALKQGGSGLEQLAELMRAFFPNETIAVVDGSLEKSTYRERLMAWETGKSHVLIGLPDVIDVLPVRRGTFVLIADIDQWLRVPDFRAEEYCLQYLAKLTGGGMRFVDEVWVQAYSGRAKGIHDIISCLRHDDVGKLYPRMLVERRACGYPPFTKVLRIVLHHENREILDAFEVDLGNWVSAYLGCKLYGRPLRSYREGVHRIVWLKVPKDQVDIWVESVRRQVHERLLGIYKGLKAWWVFD